MLKLAMRLWLFTACRSKVGCYKYVESSKRAITNELNSEASVCTVLTQDTFGIGNFKYDIIFGLRTASFYGKGLK